ncbi:MAG: MBL fold metallo-hydrolase [Candidatus Eremiobacteraeota bacterium]|nr:MBL fold metallo-hydrolase [Candidatus Eremiobacteraeota bacterium]
MAARLRRGPRQGRARGSPITLTTTARLTVAGSSSSIPRPDRACSSYLVDDGETPIVLDLGTGALANLRRHVDYDRIAAVVISHMHADHFIDLVPLRYALRYGPRRRKQKLPVHLPPGGLTMLRTLVSAFAHEGGEFLDDVFDLYEYDPSRALAIDGATLRFAHTAHYIPAFAVRWERHGASVTYSADTAPDERVVALARETDVFVCEATLRHGEVEPGIRGHSSAADAGRMARDAGVGRLLLTHYGEESTARDLDEDARTNFAGDVLVADDHRTFDLG